MMVLCSCALLIPFGIYVGNSPPPWHQILCDNSPLDILEECLPWYLHKFQKKSSHFSYPVLLPPTILYYYLIFWVILHPWMTYVSSLHIFEFKSNILTLLLRLFNSFSSSHVGPTIQMKVPDIFIFGDDIQLASMGNISLHTSWSTMSLSHLYTESEFPSIW